MCGILGVIGNHKLNEHNFKCALDKMTHRGPDGFGIYSLDGVFLGHRRLSIIDISEDGSQPMKTKDNRFIITFNGEIYNYKALKEELSQKGYSFFSNSDTEVLLNSYIEWEEKCLDKLEGIFAFGIWDNLKRKLFLARDKIGVKPLFYSICNNTIIFSSEIESILMLKSNNKYNNLALDSFFSFSYIPAPMTAYKDIFQLEPSNYLVFQNAKHHIYKYWDVNLVQNKLFKREEELIEELDFLIDKVVKKQSVSDVKIGTFLSGGIDSYAITRSLKKIEPSFSSYSIGFDNKKYCELDYTFLAAESLGVDLKYKKASLEDDKLLENVIKHSQEFFADSSSIPLYKLCEFASKDLKVILSGDGADELFGGYDTYKASSLVKIFQYMPDFILNGFLKPIFENIPQDDNKYTFKEKVLRFINGINKGPYNAHAYWREIFTQDIKNNLYTKDFLKEVEGFNPMDPYVNKIQHAKELGCSDLDSFLYADLTFYLPNDMLVKVDRMSMANGLEVRVPFLDPEIVDFAFSIPSDLKINKNVKKYILRKVIDKSYPKELQTLPKSGFNFPPDDKLIKKKYPNDNLFNKKSISNINSFSQYHSFLLNYTKEIYYRNK